MHQTGMLSTHLPHYWPFFSVLYWINVILVAFIFSLTVAQWFTNVEVTGWLSPYFWFIYLISLAGIEILGGLALIWYTWYKRHRRSEIPGYVRGYFSGVYAIIWVVSGFVNTMLFGFAYDLYVDCIEGAGFFASPGNIVLGVAYDVNVATCYTRTSIINVIIFCVTGLELAWYFVARYYVWNTPYMFMPLDEIAPFMHTDSKKPSKKNSSSIVAFVTQ
jgi:hypothetical protein